MKSRFTQTRDSNGDPAMQRRALLKGAAAIACGAAGAGAIAGAPIEPAQVKTAQSAAPLIAGSGEAIAVTRTGRVAGYLRRGIFTFKGIPYADSCAGLNRFMPPL